MENINKEDFWLVGFADGESCFSISFNLRAKMNYGIEIRPSFSVSQKRDRENVNYEVLVQIMNFFHGGSIRFSKSDQTWKYETRNIEHINSQIIPYFENFSLRTSKKNDFLRFKRVCSLIKSKHHLSIDGIKEIIEISSTMNVSGKRKFSKDFLLRLVSKVKI
jgi:LAGLIDADG endonuclease